MADSLPTIGLRDESADWLNMEDFSEGIETNRVARSHDLVGRSITIHDPEGNSLDLTFSDGTVSWRAEGFAWAGAGSDVYEEVPLAGGGYWVDFSLADRGVETLTVALHPEKGWALIVHSRGHDEAEDVETRVMQTYHGGTIDGTTATADAVPVPTRDLIGRRTLFRYSPAHLYEHIYLSSRRFTWHNLVGEQRGHAATELATTYKLDDDLYLFTWREEKIPVGTVFVFDYAAGRSTGKFIGVEGDGTIANSPGGAVIIPFGSSNYGDFQEPV
jgi:hypothetical protein